MQKKKSAVRYMQCRSQQGRVRNNCQQLHDCGIQHTPLSPLLPFYSVINKLEKKNKILTAYSYTSSAMMGSMYFSATVKENTK